MKLTETERIILENTDERYKYIARDVDGELSVHVSKPKKRLIHWLGNDMKRFNFSMFNHLFQDIQWEDKEPYKFR
jgi:hypothetical protein